MVYEKLFGNRDVKINCAAADFVATNGVLDSRIFALDTDDAVINIDGNVNLRDESHGSGRASAYQGLPACFRCARRCM